jgi:hypothetical protein
MKSKRSFARAFENNSRHIDMALFPVVSALGLFALTFPVCRSGNDQLHRPAGELT